MHEYIYPSVLQKAAIPVLKKSDSKNIIIRYQELSGVKMTLLVPLVHNQIKHSLKASGE